MIGKLIEKFSSAVPRYDVRWKMFRESVSFEPLNFEAIKWKWNLIYSSHNDVSQIDNTYLKCDYGRKFMSTKVTQAPGQKNWNKPDKIRVIRFRSMYTSWDTWRPFLLPLFVPKLGSKAKGVYGVCGLHFILLNRLHRQRISRPQSISCKAESICGSKDHSELFTSTQISNEFSR